MKIPWFLILPAFVLAFWSNYTFGTITGISILNSHFIAEGHTQDASYLVEDPIYASGSTGGWPYSMETEFASSEAGFFTSGDEDFLIASAEVEGVTAFAKGFGTIEFLSIAESMTITLYTVTSDLEYVYDYGGCGLIDLTNGIVIFQTTLNPTNPEQSFAWIPYIDHIYRLTLHVELQGDYYPMDTQLYIEIVPEPATFSLFVLGTILAGRKKRAE